MHNPSTCDCGCDKACKIGEHLDIKNCSCKKWLFDKLVLACEDEILNTGEATSIINKKVTYQKNNRFIHTVSLATICSLF